MSYTVVGWSWRWCLSLGIIGACMFVAFKVLDFLWWRPKRLEEHFARQGIRGPPYRFFVGCVKEMVGLMFDASSKPMMPQTSHNILPRVLSFYHHWKKIYGTCSSSSSSSCHGGLYPDLIREIFLSRSDVFERYESHPLVRQLEGKHLIPFLFDCKFDTFSGSSRLATNLTLALDQLLIPFIGKTVLDMVEKLPTSGEEVEIDVSEWFQTVTEDTITRTAFGRSYDDGKAVFQLQAQQMVFAAEAFRKVFIPGYRFLPTKKNTNSWKLEKEIKRSLIRLIGRRKERLGEEGKPDGSVKDLLGLMIDASASKQGAGQAASPKPPVSSPPSTITVRDIVEECKTFFFAGKQTTSNLLTWTTVLLAMHPEWQERARAEVLRVCGARDLPTRDHLAKLKTVPPPPFVRPSLPRQ
ncbi:hypothetical protein BHE74_00043284 [Ensete ventricosum]|nr:hypothetical protein BHE74_00043284 [Ensete ventricosum]